MSKNIAVIGCGYWGKNLVRNFHELDSLCAICDADEGLLKSFKEKYPDLKTFTDYLDILKHPDIKAVVIATPAETHYSVAKDALLAGKDTYVEKPIAIHYKDGEELVAIASKENRILMVGHILQYHPAVLKLKQLIKNGDIGDVLMKIVAAVG